MDAAIRRERKYQITRLNRGDYLLPSNDGRTLWRIYSYEEDGSAETYQGRVIKGTFWANARRPMPREGVAVGDLLDWSDWEFWAGPFDSRSEAIEEALRVV